MKKKCIKILYFIVLGFLLLSMYACDKKEGVNMQKLVTRQWLEQQYGITDEELTGVSIEEIVSQYNWTQEGVVNKFGDDKDVVLKNLYGFQALIEEEKELQEKKDAAGFKYMFQAGKCDGQLPDRSQLIRVGIKTTYDIGDYYCHYSVLVDYSEGKIYYGHGGNSDNQQDVIDSTLNAVYIYELTEEDTKFLRDAFTEKGLVTAYDEKEESGWHIALEYDNGEAYAYTMTNSHSDEEVLNMIKDYFRFWDESIYNEAVFKIWP